MKRKKRPAGAETEFTWAEPAGTETDLNAEADIEFPGAEGETEFPAEAEPAGEPHGGVPTVEQIETERRRLQRRREFGRTLRSTLYALIVVAAAAALIATLVFPVLQVTGASMTPTLENGDLVVALKTGKFETGDLIGFYWQNTLLLKRVVAGPGDYVNIDGDGNVYINGELLDEPYVKEKSLGQCDIEFPYQVPENRYFVLGDHRDTSVDSRSSMIGCVSADQVVGRVFLRVWPLKSVSLVH